MSKNDLSWLYSGNQEIQSAIQFREIFYTNNEDFYSENFQINQVAHNLLNYAQNHVLRQNLDLFDKLSSYLDKNRLTYQQYLGFAIQVSLLMSNPIEDHAFKHGLVYRKNSPSLEILKNPDIFLKSSYLDGVFDPFFLKWAMPFPFIFNSFLGIDSLIKAFLNNIVPIPITSKIQKVHEKTTDPVASALHDLYHGETYFPISSEQDEASLFETFHKIMKNFYITTLTYTKENEKHSLLLCLFFIIHEQVPIEYPLMSSEREIFDNAFKTFFRRFSKPLDTESHYENEFARINFLLKNADIDLDILTATNSREVHELCIGNFLVKCLYPLEIIFRRENETDFSITVKRNQHQIFRSMFIHSDTSLFNAKLIAYLLKKASVWPSETSPLTYAKFPALLDHLEKLFLKSKEALCSSSCLSMISQLP